MNSNLPLLSIITFLPLVGALVLLVLPGARLQKWWALGVSLATFVISCLLFVWWKAGEAGMQFVEQLPWVPQFDIQYFLGVDGLSLFLVLLTTLITVLVLLFSWEGVEKNLKGYLALMLALEAGMVGVFVALDLVLFYIFWELTLIPMYFLIGGWGDPHGTYTFLGRVMAWRVYAAVKFFLYTFVGSALMLVAILVLYAQGGTFDVLKLQALNLAPNLQTWLFLAFALAFAIKVPMFPFHTWLPAAHVEAPTAGSVILASVLLKMGTYGLVRFCLPITPDATMLLAVPILWLSIAGIIYGGFTALAQQDMKKLIAYSSVGHMGFVTLGIFVLNTRGLEGAILQMINHGVTTGALFLCVGMIYERTHSRELALATGVGRYMPWYVTFLTFFSLSSFAFPGTNSFIGEFLVLAGAFEFDPVVALAAIPGAVLAAAYMLRMLQKIVWGGTANPDQSHLFDLSKREIVVLAPFLLFVFWIGLGPQPFVDLMHVSVTNLLDQLHTWQEGHRVALALWR